MPVYNKFEEEQMTYKCEHRAANISQKILNFYENHEFLDTVIIAGINSINIRAHSTILAASSFYFLDIFRHSLSKANVIELKHMEAAPLQSIIDYMYTGCIDLSLENVECFLRMGTVLIMHDLINGCLEFVSQHITSCNCLKWFRFSNEICLRDLKKRSLNVAYDNFEELSKSKELLQLTQDELSDLLFGQNPYGDYQEYVFLSLVAWINYDKANRQDSAFKLFSNIHYEYLTPQMIVENRNSICKSVESYELICSWLQWHLSPETRLIAQDNSNLALVTDLDCENLMIQSYRPHLGTWSVDVHRTRFKNKPGCSRIVINGKLIIVGGLTDCDHTGSVDCLFLNTMKWNRIPQMKNERIESQLANLDGNLCVFGGRVNNHFQMDLIDIYNFKLREWAQIEPRVIPSKSSKIVAHNGVLYIVDLEYGFLQSYHLSSDRWTCTNIPKAQLLNFGLAAVGRFLYVIGGYNMDLFKCVSTVKRYTLTNDTWCEMAPLPEENMFLVNATKIKNKIVVSAGRGGFADLIAEYNPCTNEWKTLGQVMSGTPNFNSVICTLPILI